MTDGRPTHCVCGVPLDPPYISFCSVECQKSAWGSCLPYTGEEYEHALSPPLTFKREPQWKWSRVYRGDKHIGYVFDESDLNRDGAACTLCGNGAYLHEACRKSDLKGEPQE